MRHFRYISEPNMLYFSSTLMKNFFKKNQLKCLNVVQEVGRDPLRIPLSTPIDETVETAKRLQIAKIRLASVLPQPTLIADSQTITQPNLSEDQQINDTTASSLETDI